MWEQREVHDRVGHAEAALADLESWQDSPGGAAGLAAVRELVALYGEALDRIVRHLTRANPELPHELAADELVGHLLLVHDLHPVDVASRVRQALDRLPAPHTTAELLAVEDDLVRVRVTAAGCGSSADGLREAVDVAVRAAAPEIETVDVTVTAPATTAFVPLDALTAGAGRGRDGGDPGQVEPAPRAW
ncbi:NifU family protein [Gandjariella thermophila]|uniref:NIF system FeS cluster assembly NifU C-terminal domain-containing protein n=1 Tax=Gandjariella thermophila TaxID=1931992 RepID=A0A4D4J1A6_9PSEU|nr:NifU family protein [Gandjariella thermophila]GDY28429.1 hypothetical protein GTS_00620 [Gandjariella thermophila]